MNSYHWTALLTAVMETLKVDVINLDLERLEQINRTVHAGNHDTFIRGLSLNGRMTLTKIPQAEIEAYLKLLDMPVGGRA